MCGAAALVLELEGDRLARLRLDERGPEVEVVELHVELGARLLAHVLRALDVDRLPESFTGALAAAGAGAREAPSTPSASIAVRPRAVTLVAWCLLVPAVTQATLRRLARYYGRARGQGLPGGAAVRSARQSAPGSDP